MTVEEQVWVDLVGRKQFASARQISKKLRIPHQSVRMVLWRFSKRQVLDTIIKDKTNYYRIKE